MDLKTLKAFSQINNGIALQAGNPVRTISPAMNVYAESKTVSDIDFCIYDIQQFLSALSLTDNSRTISVQGNVMAISDAKTKLKYVGTVPSLIVTPPEDVSSLTAIAHNNEFTMTTEDYKRILQAASVLQAENIVFSWANDTVTITTESEHEDANSIEITMESCVDAPLTAKINQNTFKLQEADYVVTVSDKAMRFESTETVYYIVRVS